MGNVRSGLMFSFLGKYGVQLISMLSTVLIARMLTPTEIGTFAIASSVVMILGEIKLLGANAYLVREDALDDNKIKKAYGITILMCWSIAFALAFGSGFLANFFSQDSLQGVFVILALSFVLAPYVSVPDALMTRNFRFKEIAGIRIISVVVQLLSALGLIYLEFGFYALAWSQLACMAIRAVMSLYYTRDVQVYIPSFKGIGDIAKLGFFTSVANIVRRIHYTLADLVIGKMGSPAEVGLFSRGMGFIDFVSQLVLGGIGSVSQPYISDMKRRGNDISLTYIKITTLLCSLLWPILAVAGLSALPAIRLLFGNQWDDAAPIASLLAIWMFIKLLSFFAPSLYIAYGHEALMFRRDIAMFFILLLLLILSYPYGLTSIACAFIISAIIELCLNMFLLRKTVGLNVLGYFLGQVKPLLVTVFCMAITFTISVIFPFSTTSPFIVLVLLAVILPPAWLLITKLFNLQIYFEITSMLKNGWIRVAKKNS